MQWSILLHYRIKTSMLLTDQTYNRQKIIKCVLVKLSQLQLKQFFDHSSTTVQWNFALLVVWEFSPLFRLFQHQRKEPYFHTKCSHLQPPLGTQTGFPCSLAQCCSMLHHVVHFSQFCMTSCVTSCVTCYMTGCVTGCMTGCVTGCVTGCLVLPLIVLHEGCLCILKKSIYLL